VTAGGHDPREVLAAVRRLEADLEDLRARSRPHTSELAALREGIAADAAVERRQLVEDMELLLEVVGAGWRRTAERLDRLSAEVAEISGVADGLRRALGGARLELRFDAGLGNGQGAPAETTRAGAT
jgi:multidrug resistance efflux pump